MKRTAGETKYPGTKGLLFITVAFIVLFLSFDLCRVYSFQADRSGLAPQSAFDGDRDRPSHDALRLPTVSRERTRGKSLSFDKQIQKAEERAADEGRSLKLDQSSLAYVTGTYKALLIDKDILARFLDRLTVLAVNFQKDYPDAAGGKHVGRERFLRLFVNAVDLLNDRETGLEIRLVPPEPGDNGPSLWGFQPERGETVTDEGLDASNLPVLVRRIGRKLYIKQAFFSEFSGKDPGDSTVFWEALFRELAKDGRIAGSLGIPAGSGHNFASMMAELVRSSQEVEYENLHDDKHLHQWLLRFYKPEQLSAFLRYHTGLQAEDWRFRAFLELYNRKRADLITGKILEIIKKDEKDDHDEIEADMLFLSRVLDMYDGRDVVLNKIFNGLSKEFFSKMTMKWQNGVPIDRSVSMIDNIRVMIKAGVIGRKDIDDHVDDPEDRIYIRKLYSFIRSAVWVPMLEDRMKALAAALKEGLMHIDGIKPETIIVWNLRQFIRSIYMRAQTFPSPSVISEEFEARFKGLVSTMNTLDVALSRYDGSFRDDPYEIRIADLLMESGGQPSVLLMLIRNFVMDVNYLLEFIEGVKRGGDINRIVGSGGVVSEAA
ncbi:hypothetical protein ACFLQ8_01410 [Candidatus Auribacterota bacterium]